MLQEQRRSFLRVNKGYFPKDLNVFVIRVYCAKTSAWCMRFINFRYIKTFSLRHNDHLTSIVPESRCIVQVVQIIQTDEPKFRFAELGSNLANPPQNNKHNVYSLQKEYVTKFHKVINK